MNTFRSIRRILIHLGINRLKHIPIGASNQISVSQAQVSFDKPIDVYIPMRTDLAAPTVLSVSSSFKWNLVALDSTYKQTDFVELALALVKPTGGSTAPVASTVPLVIDVDTTDDAADPLLVG